MNTQITFRPFQPTDPMECTALVTLWNEVLPVDLPISTKFVQYNTCFDQASLGPDALPRGARALAIHQTGQWALVNHEFAGMVIASTVSDATSTAKPSGLLELLVVHPRFQRQGVGSTLLAWAETWLATQGCEQISISGSVRPFLPGIPEGLDAINFFRHHGYATAQTVWDVAANLATYEPPEIVRPIAGVVRPAQPSDSTELDLFLRREFPGRWHWGFQQTHQTAGARLSDYMVLWTERGIDGFCRLTFEDSHQPIERYYPYRLPRPWGQLGPIGVSADRRRQGLGAALLDAGLRRLHNNGVNGCVIDWTTLVDFYGHFGFAPYREYTQLSKSI